MKSIAISFLLALTMTASVVAQAPRRDYRPQAGLPRICFNAELLSAIRIINSACHNLECTKDTLRALDAIPKASLLSAMSDPNLHTLHFFFERDKADLASILHWQTVKATHMATLKQIDAKNSVVFVIGQASNTGGDLKYNEDLSQRRMASVMIHLEFVLKVKCRAFKGGYVGYDIFQLTLSDAALLRIHAGDYDGDVAKLNQAVHIFVFPCADLM